MSEIQILLKEKIGNPVELLDQINKDYNHITKEYVLSANYEQLQKLKLTKEIINNSRDGLISKIDMFIDAINAEVNPVLEPLKLAKNKLKDILLNIKELDLIEKQLIIEDNYKDCFELIITEIPDCGLTLTKMKVLNYFHNLEKQAKGVKIEDLANSFIKKYLEEIAVLNQQAPTYLEEYLIDYDLQKALLKKMEVDRMKEKEAEIKQPESKYKSQPQVMEVENTGLKKATIELYYSEEQAQVLNDFVKVLKDNKIKFNIIK